MAREEASMRTIFLAGAAAIVASSSPALASDKGWDDASRIGEVALVGTALGLPSVQGDWNGTLQAGGSIGAAWLATEGLKEAFPETRPDGSDRRSFPSGHASLSFAAAATMQNRYGWQVGLPATVLAAFVGYARVRAERHHWYDVVAGAAIGEASGFLITRQHDRDVRVLPWGDTHGGGIAMGFAF
jgi:membrane-associated phospholipid phosphatase